MSHSEKSESQNEIYQQIFYPSVVPSSEIKEEEKPKEKKKHPIQERFGKINRLLDHTIKIHKLSPIESLILVFMWRNENKGLVTIGYSRISDCLNVSKRSVGEAIRKLIEMNVIQRVQQGCSNKGENNTLSVYRLVF